MKWIFLISSTLLFGNCPCPPIDTCAPVNCAYLPTPGNYLEGDFYASFDFLWWEGTERGLEFASKNAKSSFDQAIQIYEPDFSFGPAFRLGAGVHLSHDDWDLEASYTCYYTHTIDHAHHRGGSGGGIRPIWTSAIAFQNSGFQTLWQSAEAKWNIHANLFDLFLKHGLYLTPKIVIEPSFGLKFALLQQNYKVVYQDGNTTPEVEYISSSISMKNRSLNVGPAVSFMTRWNFWDHYDLLASLSSSLLASRFTLTHKEWDASLRGTPQFDSFKERDTLWTIRPFAAANFGIGWKKSFCRNDKVIYYGISASYEAQVFFKQNMLYRFIDETSIAMAVSTQGNLFFHGLALDAFINF